MVNYSLLAIGLALVLWGLDKTGTWDGKHPFIKFLKRFIGWFYVILGIIFIFYLAPLVPNCC